ncbi:hypothetical protein AA18890_2890 [Komagataeibacter europaeus LMG 18890]|nr:hypothetical protein AA18890_2890 [Komagataeibacter europaeus LMG 18890]
MAWTSRGCIPQYAAIWVKVSAVFSISHTAVALGIKGRAVILRSYSVWRHTQAPERVFETAPEKVEAVRTCWRARNRKHSWK